MQDKEVRDPYTKRCKTVFVYMYGLIQKILKNLHPEVFIIWETNSMKSQDQKAKRK